MTAGEPTPKPKVSARPATRAVPRSGAGGTQGDGAKEPKVSVSRAGGSGTRRGGRGGSGSSGAEAKDDVLERLARLDVAPAADVDDAVALPTIVEADPSAPMEVPAGARDDATVPGDAVLLTASTPASTPIGATAADSPTALVVVPPTPAPAPEPTAAEGDAATVATEAVDESADAAPTDVSAPLVRELPVLEPTSRLAPVPPVVLPATDLPVVPIEAPVVAVPEAAPSDEPPADATDGVTLPLRRLKAPMVFRRAKPRVRRVTRVVRHVDTWSVFKVALVFNVILYLVCLTAGVLLWNVAHATGTIDNVEQFFEQFGWERFEFKGGEIYHNAWIGGLFVSVGLTGFAVLLATLFNLITDLVGGIRVSVLEEEVVAKPRGAADPTGGLPRP